MSTVMALVTALLLLAVVVESTFLLVEVVMQTVTIRSLVSLLHFALSAVSV